MHGLINSAIQAFVCATYGKRRWRHIAERAGLGFVSFEAMLHYDDGQSRRVLDIICADLGRQRDEFLEDLGTFLVTHPQVAPIRRLLRFGGETYVDFLYSLDDLPGRVRLAVPDLHLPALELWDCGDCRYMLLCNPGLDGYGSVLTGLLRAMADDYGALATLEHDRLDQGQEIIRIALIESSFARGRDFALGASAP